MCHIDCPGSKQSFDLNKVKVAKLLPKFYFGNRCCNIKNRNIITFNASLLFYIKRWMRRYKVASTSEANLVVTLQQMRPKRPMERERRRGGGGWSHHNDLHLELARSLDVVAATRRFWKIYISLSSSGRFWHRSRCHKQFFMGSGCGSVGRAVASDTRGPQFESSHRQLLLNQFFLLTASRLRRK